MSGYIAGSSGYLNANPYYAALAQAYRPVAGLGAMRPAANQQQIPGIASNYLSVQAASVAARNLLAQAQLQAQAQAQLQAQAQAQAQVANLASYANFTTPQNILHENVINELKNKTPQVQQQQPQHNYAEEYKQRPLDEPPKVQGNTIHFHF